MLISSAFFGLRDFSHGEKIICIENCRFVLAIERAALHNESTVSNERTHRPDTICNDKKFIKNFQSAIFEAFHKFVCYKSSSVMKCNSRRAAVFIVPVQNNDDPIVTRVTNNIGLIRGIIAAPSLFHALHKLQIIARKNREQSANGRYNLTRATNRRRKGDFIVRMQTQRGSQPPQKLSLIGPYIYRSWIARFPGSVCDV